MEVSFRRHPFHHQEPFSTTHNAEIIPYDTFLEQTDVQFTRRYAVYHWCHSGQNDVICCNQNVPQMTTPDEVNKWHFSIPEAVTGDLRLDISPNAVDGSNEQGSPLVGGRKQKPMRRNARERNRVRMINSIFARLRQKLPLAAAYHATELDPRQSNNDSATPTVYRARKLSKVEFNSVF